MLDLDAVHAAVAREWGRFYDLLASGAASSWSQPTRLGEWTVRDLAAHAVLGMSMEADGLRRRGSTTGARAAGREPDPGAGADVLLAELAAARDELVGELARVTDEDLGALAPLPYGDVPIALFSQILVMEAGVHTSDLAAAAGADDGLEADVVAATETVLRVFLPGIAASAPEAPEAGVTVALRGPTVALAFQYLDGQWQAPDAAAAPQPTLTIAGDDSSLLLFALGRVGVDDRRLSLTGETAVAGRFKSWLPGP